MAVLTEAELDAVWARFMRINDESVDVTKNDLREMVDAIDTWIDDNAASFNNALPVATRTALTQRQKMRAFVFVLEKRFGVL